MYRGLLLLIFIPSAVACVVYARSTISSSDGVSLLIGFSLLAVVFGSGMLLAHAIQRDRHRRGNPQATEHDEATED
jgi:hypothetical protein